MQRSTESVALELQSLPNEAALAERDDEQQDGSHAYVLPPVDQGPEAWKFLFASFFIEALLWGESSHLPRPASSFRR